MNNHEIDYEIVGDDMQFVEIELAPRETTVAEAGALMMMEQGIVMETIFGDGSDNQKGFMGKLLGSGKRLLTGESLFTFNSYGYTTSKKDDGNEKNDITRLFVNGFYPYSLFFICER